MSKSLVVTTVVVASLLAVVVLGFVATYARVLGGARRVPALERQNAELMQEVESVQELGRMMEDLNALRAQVLAMLGSVDESDVRAMEPLKGLAEEEPDPFANPSQLREVFADAARRPFAPTLWPLPGRVLREFIPAADGDQPPHLGLSIATDATAEVIAAGRGRVVAVGPDQDGDTQLILDHGYGFQSLYRGIGDLRVELGQVVEQGSPLGQATGLRGSRAEQSALYFEIDVDGVPADPRRYLSSR